MPESPLENVVAHWNKLVENFQTSPKDFYASLETALELRGIPGLKASRIDWREGGMLSPRREYYCVTGDRHSFDICAAPFGTGFFFSSWLTQRKPRWVFLAFLLLLVVALTIWQLLLAAVAPFGLSSTIVLVSRVIFLPMAFLITLWLVAIWTRLGKSGLELAVLGIPVIGWIYERLFVPTTYYRIDTMLMFQSAVHSAMLETIDSLMEQKGLRVLSEEERKPIFHKLT